MGGDFAKNVFALHGVDEAGQVVLVRPDIGCGKLLELMVSLTPCLVGMETRSGAHHGARQPQKPGHTARIVAPEFVASYHMSGKHGKNDAADAAAICEAVQRPHMHFVPIKSVEQQDQFMVHRVRHGFVQDRTALISRVRGLLCELGSVQPLKARTVRREALLRLGDLPGRAGSPKPATAACATCWCPGPSRGLRSNASASARRADRRDRPGTALYLLKIKPCAARVIGLNDALGCCWSPLASPPVSRAQHAAGWPQADSRGLVSGRGVEGRLEVPLRRRRSSSRR